MSLKQLLIATNNDKKLKELKALLDESNISNVELLTLKDLPENKQYPEPEETGSSFEENAIIKADAGYLNTDIATISDDSGICVPVLNDDPGIFSARWAQKHDYPITKTVDEANLNLLLNQISSHEEPVSAYYISVCAFKTSQNKKPIITTGKWIGTISKTPKGENGFGYDPIFIPNETPDKSAAQLDAADKNGLSHRNKALKLLIPEIEKWVKE